MMTSELLDKLFEAVAKTQLEMPAVSKSESMSNGAMYAPIDELWHVVRPFAAKNGLSDIWMEEANEEGIKFLVGILAHSSGQCIVAKAQIYADPKDTKAFPNVKGKLRRRMYKDFFGIVEKEDDFDEEYKSKPQSFPKQQEIKTEIINNEELKEIQTFCKQKPEIEEIILKTYNVKNLYDLPKNAYSKIMGKK